MTKWEFFIRHPVHKLYVDKDEKKLNLFFFLLKKYFYLLKFKICFCYSTWLLGPKPIQNFTFDHIVSKIRKAIQFWLEKVFKRPLGE